MFVLGTIKELIIKAALDIPVTYLFATDHDEEPHHADEEVLEPREIVEPNCDHADVRDECVGPAHDV